MAEPSGSSLMHLKSDLHAAACEQTSWLQVCACVDRWMNSVQPAGRLPRDANVRSKLAKVHCQGATATLRALQRPQPAGDEARARSAAAARQAAEAALARLTDSGAPQPLSSEPRPARPQPQAAPRPPPPPRPQAEQGRGVRGSPRPGRNGVTHPYSDRWPALDGRGVGGRVDGHAHAHPPHGPGNKGNASISNSISWGSVQPTQHSDTHGRSAGRGGRGAARHSGGRDAGRGRRGGDVGSSSSNASTSARANGVAAAAGGSAVHMHFEADLPPAAASPHAKAKQRGRGRGRASAGPRGAVAEAHDDELRAHDCTLQCPEMLLPPPELARAAHMQPVRLGGCVRSRASRSVDVAELGSVTSLLRLRGAGVPVCEAVGDEPSTPPLTPPPRAHSAASARPASDDSFAATSDDFDATDPALQRLPLGAHSAAEAALDAALARLSQSRRLFAASTSMPSAMQRDAQAAVAWEAGGAGNECASAPLAAAVPAASQRASAVKALLEGSLRVRIACAL